MDGVSIAAQCLLSIARGLQRAPATGKTKNDRPRRASRGLCPLAGAWGCPPAYQGGWVGRAQDAIFTPIARGLQGRTYRRHSLTRRRRSAARAAERLRLFPT